MEGIRYRFNKAHKKTQCTILKKRFYALKTGMRVRNMKRATKLVQCAVILHNICILFTDNGDDLLDDEDLDIVNDELDIDHGGTTGQTAAAAAAFPMSVQNDDINDTSKLQLFQYRQYSQMTKYGQNKNSQMTKYTPFF